MNKVEHTVTKVLSAPYFNYLWCVDVEAVVWGAVVTTTVQRLTLQEAESIVVGYKFNA